MASKALLRRVSGNFLWTLLGELFAKIPLFFMYVYLARVLGVENYGVFSGAQAIVLYVWLAVDLGTSMYGIKEIASEKNNKGIVISALMSLRLFFGVLVFIVHAGIFYVFVNELEVLIVFIAIGLFLIIYSLYPDWILKGFEAFKVIVYGNFLSGLMLIAMLMMFVQGEDDLVAAAIVWPSSYAFGAIVMWFWLIKFEKVTIDFKIDIASWIKHIRKSVMFSVNGALIMLYQYLPLFFLGVFYGAYEIGIFSSGYKLIFAFCTIGFFLPMAAYPVLSSMSSNDKNFNHIIKTMRTVLLVIGCLIGYVVIYWSSEIVMAVYGTEYRDAGNILKIVGFIIPITYVRYSYGIPLASMGLQHLNSKGALMAMLGAFITGATLIPFDALRGAALSILLAESIYLAMLWRAYNSHVRYIYRGLGVATTLEQR